MRVVAVSEGLGLVIKLVPEGREEIGAVSQFFKDADTVVKVGVDTFVMLGVEIPSGTTAFALVIERPKEQVVN